MIADPDAVRVGRHIDDQGDWIIATYETEFEGEPLEVQIAVGPTEFVGFITASLNALGFPESDCEYIAERWAKDNRSS